ncbi:MAG: hypothetical protein ABL871_04635 [Terricaulis sp.]
MRHWLLHPIVFYPLAIVIACLAIVVSLRPQSWPREPAPVSAVRDGDWLVYQGDGFNTPDQGAEEVTVVRDYFGRPLRLRVAQTMAQPAPEPDDEGARILLSAEDAALLNGKPLIVEVSYNPLPVNAATELAVSARGGGPAPWVTQTAPPETATLRFNLPAQNGVNAIALRPISTSEDMAYGLEITRIRIMPRT